jgi:hypothetical protein
MEQRPDHDVRLLGHHGHMLPVAQRCIRVDRRGLRSPGGLHDQIDRQLHQHESVVRDDGLPRFQRRLGLAQGCADLDGIPRKSRMLKRGYAPLDLARVDGGHL